MPKASTQPNLDYDNNEFIKSAGHDAFVNAIINDWCDELPHKIKLKDNFNTACWVFHNKTHHIYIGNRIFNDTRKGFDPDDYVAALVHHEMAHALWTCRDLDRINKLLKVSNIPFKLLNLFEDARIEDLWRSATDTRFDWESLDNSFEVDSPLSCFYALIYFEGERDKIETDVDVDLIYSYYTRTLNAPTTSDLLPILCDWIEEFGQETGDMPQTGMPSSNQKPDDENGNGGGSSEYGDLGYALEVMETGDLSAMESGCHVIDGNANEDDEGTPAGPSETESNNGTMRENKSNIGVSAELLRPEPLPLDERYIGRVAGQIKRVFDAPTRYKATNDPSRRINKRSLSGNKDVPMYARKEGVSSDKVKVNLILDCSGSMHGEPMDNATHIVAVFNQLALMQVIDCTVLLSYDNPEPYPAIQLPLDTETIATVAQAQCGGEGLEMCYQRHVKEMKQAKMNFIITDGDLSDGEIDKRFYQAQGIYTVGLYCGNIEHTSDLTRWFDKGIVRSDLDSLFSSMVFMLK